MLPDAIFRRIKQSASGKAIALNDDDETPVAYSQESWWEYLLCKICEGKIKDYETYGFQMLRGARHAQVHKHSSGLTFRNHRFREFKLFLTSLIWRAAVSSGIYFSKVIIPTELLEAPRKSLLDAKPLGPTQLGCKIMRLADPTPVEEGGFPSQVLKQIVTSPFARLHGNTAYYSIVFIFEGFVFEFFVPAVPKVVRAQRGVHQRSKILSVPFVDFKSVPELFKLMVAGYRKTQRGLVSFEN